MIQNIPSSSKIVDLNQLKKIILKMLNPKVLEMLSMNI